MTEAADVIAAVAPIMERPIMLSLREDDGDPLSSDPAPASALASSACSGRARVDRRPDPDGGCSPAIVRTVLLELELAGRLERHGGGLVSLI